MIITDIQKAWLETRLRCYDLQPVGVCISHEAYDEFSKELRAIQHQPQDSTFGFDLGIRVNLQGLNYELQVYRCGFDFEGIHFLI